MTYLFNKQIDYEPHLLDAFTRLRVSTPLTLFEHNNQYGTNTFKWETSVTGTGAVTDTFNDGTLLSTGGTASGANAIRQSRAYMRFFVGKSLLLSMTFKFGTGVSGAVQRVGYYDTNNGVYLQQNGTTVSLVIRTDASGSVVENAVTQSSWNIDKLDGTGPSGVTLNMAASQNMRMDFHGPQLIRIYFFFGGVYWLVHQVDNSNQSSPPTPSPSSANLPIRQEVLNLSAVSGTATITVTNANVMSEGSVEPSPSFIFSDNNGSTAVALSGLTPVLSLQANSVFGSTANRNYGWIIPNQLGVVVDNTVMYQLILNGTLTGASFSSFNSKSIANVDTAATAISGGTVIKSGYLSANKAENSSFDSIQLYFPLVYSSLLGTKDTLTVALTPFGTGTHGNASLSWSEYY